MRLTALQIEKIQFVLNDFFKEIQFELFLYGSCTDDSLKGGDIDLLVVTTENGVDLFKIKKLDILVAVKKHSEIGQRKIELKAATSEQLISDSFLKSIANDMQKVF